MFIKVFSKTQNLLLFSGFDDNKPHIKSYKISTSRFGLGEEKNSFCTPRGMHIIRAMIGHNCPINTNFVGRRVVEKSKIESKFHSSIPYFRFRYIFYDSMLITTCKIPVASGFFQIPDYRLPLVSPDSSAEIPDSSTPERFALLFFYWYNIIII